MGQFRLENIYFEIKSWMRFVCRNRNGDGFFVTNFSLMCVIIVFLSTISIIQCADSTIMGGSCDWLGSGLESDVKDGQGVTPVYVRCTAGKIAWAYPRGALRLLLRLPENQHFRACIKLRGDTDVVRVFLEGSRSLHPLYSASDKTKPVRCFQSKKGKAAVYVESTDWRGIDKKSVELQYDLQPLVSETIHYDASEECRPCSSDELVRAFCTSNLVTRGIIRAVDHFDDLETSQLHVKVTKMIRFASTDDLLTSHSKMSKKKTTQGGKGMMVELNMPRHCGASHGEGEFVFMAREKLGELSVTCAPRLEDWLRIVRTLPHHQCVLHS